MVTVFGSRKLVDNFLTLISIWLGARLRSVVREKFDPREQ